MAEENMNSKLAEVASQRKMIMTDEQREAYDEFISYMAQLYRKYAYLFEDEGNQEEGESVG